ncbi:MAG: NUDIX domain-containing protein [Patescibacteria group bacterium]|nr:NUDIX domain-containing protein [Patescibacteria group bacterium]
MKLKKTVYILSLPIRRLYWFIFRTKTFGVKCMIECNGKYFLVKNSYGGNSWTFPGGGIKRGESPESAVRREVKEETGITLGNVEKIGEYQSELEYKKDTVYCYHAKVSDPTFVIDTNEISEAGWFESDKIPEPSSSAVLKVLEMIKK